MGNVGRPAGGAGRIDFSGPRPDTGAMGVRTRGLDIKAGAAKLRADRAARVEAELVVDRWNRRLATGTGSITPGGGPTTGVSGNRLSIPQRHAVDQGKLCGRAAR
jgi:hypothetical protein